MQTPAAAFPESSPEEFAKWFPGLPLSNTACENPRLVSVHAIVTGTIVRFVAASACHWCPLSGGDVPDTRRAACTWEHMYMHCAATDVVRKCVSPSAWM